jgi:hypothetical protein
MTQLGLVELHTRDGSALDAGCHCIETKHLRLIDGLTAEGQSFAMSEQEKQFFKELGDLARSLRKTMELEHWDIHEALHEAGLNPSTPKRHFPVTPCKKRLADCIKDLAHDSSVNAFAVCNAQIKCP